MTWRKSSYSNEDQSCVEVAVGRIVGVRDTKDRRSGHLTVPPEAWRALLTTLQTG